MIFSLIVYFEHLYFVFILGFYGVPALLLLKISLFRHKIGARLLPEGAEGRAAPVSLAQVASFPFSFAGLFYNGSFEETTAFSIGAFAFVVLFAVLFLYGAARSHLNEKTSAWHPMFALIGMLFVSQPSIALMAGIVAGFLVYYFGLIAVRARRLRGVQSVSPLSEQGGPSVGTAP